MLIWYHHLHLQLRNKTKYDNLFVYYLNYHIGLLVRTLNIIQIITLFVDSFLTDPKFPESKQEENFIEPNYSIIYEGQS